MSSKKVFKIESEIPIPKRFAASRLGLANTIRKMNNGDSIVIPRKGSTSIYTTAKGVGKKITTRLVSKTKLRVWVIGEEAK